MFVMRRFSPYYLIILSQLVLAASIIACTVILPQFFWSSNQGGISNYGVHHETALLFSVGFGGCGGLLLWAAACLPVRSRHHHWLKVSIVAVAVLILLVAVTTYTYKLSPLLDKLHIASTFILFFAQLPLAIWYAFWLDKSRPARLLFWSYGAGLVLLGLTYFNVIHILFIAEVVAAFSFGLLLAVVVWHVQLAEK